ncbi:hypothetical protein BDV39DRAFT_180178 [Aspergillus sergii]|uniref:Uncharacterized protein n=1 Tax=Aspergillus sergii TaxID=1034303 RepID=A0A5N6WUX1_9EURO|nr:hypothetical protein BDV39DRAFT_180178 [Aspergillus sergii]
MVLATAWTVLIRNGFSLSRFPFVSNLDFWVQAVVLVCSGMTKNVSALSKLRQIQMGKQGFQGKTAFYIVSRKFG